MSDCCGTYMQEVYTYLNPNELSVDTFIHFGLTYSKFVLLEEVLFYYKSLLPFLFTESERIHFQFILDKIKFLRSELSVDTLSHLVLTYSEFILLDDVFSHYKRRHFFRNKSSFSESKQIAFQSILDYIKFFRTV